MNKNTLPETVVETDHRLEASHEKATEKLAQQRWKWTLDETNPNRVSLHAYAKAVGRNIKTIRTQAGGYARWLNQGEGPGPLTLADCIALAAMSDERGEVAQAIAKAEGTTVAAVSKHHAPRVREVQVQAQERAERRGTSVAEEARYVADRQRAVRETNATQRAEEQADHTGQYIVIEGHLAYAKRRMTEALKAAEHVELSGEEMDLLRGSINQVRSLIELLDVRMGGELTDEAFNAELKEVFG